MIVVLISVSVYLIWLLLMTKGFKKYIYKKITIISVIVSSIVIFFYTKIPMFLRVWFSYDIVSKLEPMILYYKSKPFWRGCITFLKLHKKLTVLPFWPWFCITYYFYWQAYVGRIATKSIWKVQTYCKRTNYKTKDNRTVFDLRIDFLSRYVTVILHSFWTPIKTIYGNWARRMTREIFRKITHIKTTRFGETLTSIFFRHGENKTHGWIRLYLVMAITWLMLVKLFCDYHVVLGPVLGTIIIIVSAPIFILWQTFVFFFKSYQISKFTSANQMFWKRALFLFWALESFLFLITLFIILIAPDNLKIGVGHRILHLQIFVSPLDMLEMLWIPTILIIYTRATIIKKKNNSNINIWLLFTNFLIFFIVIGDLNQLLGVYNMTNTSATITKTLYNIETLQLVEFSREDVVKNQMKLLLLFVKFWHILFIAGFVQFVTLRTLEIGSISYDLLSATIYNLNYLFIFNVLFFIYAHNKLLYFLLMEVPNYYGSENLDQFFYNILCGVLHTIKSLFDF